MGFLHTNHWSDSYTMEIQLGITYLEQFKVHGTLRSLLAKATKSTINAILLLSIYIVYNQNEYNSPWRFHCSTQEQ
jgi:hypothetical protein